MPSEIRYKGLREKPVSGVIAYCLEAPREVLAALGRQWRVWSYRGMDRFLVGRVPGIVINECEQSIPGSSITGSLKSIQWDSIMKGITGFYREKYEQCRYSYDLSNEEIERALAFHMNHEWGDHYNAHHDWGTNYVHIRADNGSGNGKGIRLFDEQKAKFSHLLEAAREMLGIQDTKQLDEMLEKYYPRPKAPHPATLLVLNQ